MAFPGEKDPLIVRAFRDSEEAGSAPVWEVDEAKESVISKRNLVGFWLLGLCNNFGCLILLSAAYDILGDSDSEDKQENSTLILIDEGADRDGLECNPLSTGTVLLAGIIPALLIKMTAPFYMQKIKYSVRMTFCVLCSFASFTVVGLTHTLWVSLLGVVFASISAGLGEITLLSYSSHFDINVVSTWSSGTGAAGILSALSYASLTSGGVSPRLTLLIMNATAVIWGISFWFILKHPTVDEKSLLTPKEEGLQQNQHLTLGVKMAIVKSLLKYMLPLFFVYFAEYFINQGLHELIYWNNIWLTPAEQYRWYQVDYQIGVFISRSSVNIFPIQKIWLLALLQNVNLVLLVCEAYFHFFPSIWVMFIIVLYEGMFGGACYVNTFYRISKEVKPEHREFSLGVASIADSIGITTAGITALPTHNALCAHWKKKATFLMGHSSFTSYRSVTLTDFI